MADFEKLFEEYIEGGMSEEAARRYTTASELYYKAFLKIIDDLLQKQNIIIGTHKQRFEAIERLNSDIKSLNQKLHSIYKQTYKTKNDRKDCNEIKNGIKKIIFLKHIEGRIKELAEAI